MTFKALHQQQAPLIICNVWDVPSAQLGEKLGYQALGTSSAAIAHMLGKNDGEQVLFSELIYLVKHILSAVNVPLTVDIESGYGRSAQEVASNILQLAQLGVKGINIEDSRLSHSDNTHSASRHLKTMDSQETDSKKTGQPHRALQAKEAFAARLDEVLSYLRAAGADIFINVRTDTCLLRGNNLSQALTETKARIALYQGAGADGIFVPGVTALSDISAIANTTDLPVNVMCMPGLADFTELKRCGVKRISMGNFVYENMLNSLATVLADISAKGSFDPLFN